jgi:RNHCP domain
MSRDPSDRRPPRHAPTDPTAREAYEVGEVRVHGAYRGERRGGKALRLPAEAGSKPPVGDPATGGLPPSRHPGRGHGHTPEQSFRCGHCKRFVGLLPSGGRQRNHCPYCLYSRHVDDRRPGDRAAACSSLMAPVGAFQRPNGEHCIVHRCLGCGFERFNRIGADDDFDLVLALPVLPPRSARPGAELGEGPGPPPATQ